MRVEIRTAKKDYDKAIADIKAGQHPALSCVLSQAINKKLKSGVFTSIGSTTGFTLHNHLEEWHNIKLIGLPAKAAVTIKAFDSKTNQRYVPVRFTVDIPKEYLK